ncbi:MAG: phage tail tube protein [Burkholderiales bacterium]
MTTNVYKPYLGSGQVYARIAGSAAGLLPVGNVSELTLEASEDKKTLKDYTRPGGGTYASVTRIENVTTKMTLHDLNKTNLARAAFGNAITIESDTVVDEAVVAYLGALVPLAHIGATDVVVTNAAGITTYVLGTDYEVQGGGLLILAGGSIVQAAPLLVSYTFPDYSKIEGITQSAVILELHFEGLNEADSGKPVILDIFRAQLSPSKALSLLGDDFAELEMEAEVLKDPSKSGVGISQFYRVKQV